MVLNKHQTLCNNHAGSDGSEVPYESHYTTHNNAVIQNIMFLNSPVIGNLSIYLLLSDLSHHGDNMLRSIYVQYDLLSIN